MHDTAAEVAEYLPAAHSRHELAPPLVPAFVIDPAAQSEHDATFDAVEYLPAAHAVHVPPFGPVKPALHAQSEEASLPAGEDDPAMMPSRQLAVHVAGYFGYAISICILQHSFMES